MTVLLHYKRPVFLRARGANFQVGGANANALA